MNMFGLFPVHIYVRVSIVKHDDNDDDNNNNNNDNDVEETQKRYTCVRDNILDGKNHAC